MKRILVFISIATLMSTVIAAPTYAHGEGWVEDNGGRKLSPYHTSRYSQIQEDNELCGAESVKPYLD